MYLSKTLLATLLLTFFSSLFAQEPKDVKSVVREQENRALIRQLGSALDERGIDAINRELRQRVRNHDSLENALIRCVQSDPGSGPLQSTRYLAARLLGEYKSVKAVPALLENLSWEIAGIGYSDEFVLGEILLTYPCVRSVIDVGALAEPLIIEHVMRTPKISDLEIELAAYCLLKIKCGDERIYDFLADSVREELQAQISAAIEKGEGNVAGLNRLSDFAGKVEVFVYDLPEAAKKRGFSFPIDSPFARKYMGSEAKGNSETEPNNSAE